MSWSLEGDLMTNLDGMDRRVQRAMVGGALFVKPKAIAMMKDNAPWTDRTSAARNGLNAEVVVDGKTVGIVLYHTVPYGVFLETRWGGKFAVIEQTMESIAPMYIEAIERLVAQG